MGKTEVCFLFVIFKRNQAQCVNVCALIGEMRFLSWLQAALVVIPPSSETGLVATHEKLFPVIPSFGTLSPGSWLIFVFFDPLVKGKKNPSYPCGIWVSQQFNCLLLTAALHFAALFLSLSGTLCLKFICCAFDWHLPFLLVLIVGLGWLFLFFTRLPWVTLGYLG